MAAEPDIKSYSENEVNHIVARRVAEEQMNQLGNRVSAMESDNTKVFADIRATLSGINEAIVTKSQEMMACKSDIKREMSNEFVTEKIFNLEMTRMEELVDANIESLSKEMKSGNETIHEKIQGQWKVNAITNTILLMIVGFIFKIVGGV